MAIVNPFITKADNIKWLEDNEETFLRYMAEHHSPIDLAHTYLHMDTLNDNYIEVMILSIKKHEAKIEKEAKARKRKAAGKKVTEDPKATVIEKAMAKMEEAADNAITIADEDLLLD